MGAAYGTSKAGIGIAGLGSFRPELIMKVRTPLSVRPDICAHVVLHNQSLIPVVMSGIIAVYGLVVSVLIAGDRASLSPRIYAGSDPVRMQWIPRPTTRSRRALSTSARASRAGSPASLPATPSGVSATRYVVL
jgi:hypothetical protein